MHSISCYLGKVITIKVLKELIFPILVYMISVSIISTAYSAEVLIKPGNIVHITVLGYPELSSAVLVRQDGSTNYPLLSNIPIDGMTIRQLQDVLLPILARNVERPKLFINLAEEIQIEVLIEGQVRNPGRYTVKGPINLQGVLSIAGGTTREADLRNISISRQTSFKQKEITVDMYQFFLDKENFPIPDINEGDIIFVPIISSTSTVRVIGAVNAPGSYIPTKDQNIIDMINIAGGVSSSGNLNHVIYISIQASDSKSELIKLKALLNKGLTDQIPLVQPGDIVVVSEYKEWQKMSSWLYLFRDTALLLSSIVILSRL
ncbi:MAG: SLBB domain-containing protein [Candidatus Electryonea clarkiae]|nr:SLBB domain-containing protein [Candidatus Electryonea clarkiae]MDP8285857.1 SLBB domain-containing protein [Candidatus Electryonea clarkiae]